MVDIQSATAEIRRGKKERKKKKKKQDKNIMSASAMQVFFCRAAITNKNGGCGQYHKQGYSPSGLA